jgi:hypothetical protein
MITLEYLSWKFHKKKRKRKRKENRTKDFGELLAFVSKITIETMLDVKRPCF